MSGVYPWLMGPLSAVVIAFWLFIFGATAATWISASPHFYGILAIVVAVIVLLDAFWIGSGRRWDTYRGRTQA